MWARRQKKWLQGRAAEWEFQKAKLLKAPMEQQNSSTYIAGVREENGQSIYLKIINK